MTSIYERITEYSRQGRFYDLIKILEEELLRVETQEETLELKYQLAEAHYSVRDFNNSKKLIETILPSFNKLYNYSMVGHAENLLGKIYRIHKRYIEALTHYQKAEKAFEQTKDNEGLSKVYHNIGNAYVFLQRLKEAKKFHFRALEIAQHIGNSEAIAISHLSIGSMFYQNGEVDLALFHFDKARNLFEEVQNIPNLAATYHNLAEVFLIRKKFTNALKSSSQAVSYYKKIENPLGQHLALTTLARSAKSAGFLDQAIDAYNQAFSINPTEDILLELGESYLNQNQIENGRKVFERVLELPTRTLRGEGYSLDYLAKIAINEKDFDQALNIYFQLLEVLKKIKPHDPESIVSTQGNLGYMYLKIGNSKLAWEYLVQTCDYFKKKKIWNELITLGNNYRNEYVVRNDYKQAIILIRDIILPAVKKSQNKVLENQYHYEVALLNHIEGNTKEGLCYWEKYSTQKIPFQRYPTFLLTTVEERTKISLEKHHQEFLKHISKKLEDNL
ncbi:MAG: tetratricopeptide repeat protein [Promethearchaeota archaeon]